MNTSSRGEFALIDWIRRHSHRHDDLLLGIGDDAAALNWPIASPILCAVDTMTEGVHFTFEEATPRDVGRKALAVNLSDIAAMAGLPRAALVSVVAPRSNGEAVIRELHLGLAELAKEFDVAIAGGDTNTWDGPLVITVTVLGEVTGSGPVTRSGAMLGDAIFVTGSLGGSRTGHHLHFQPRVTEAIELHLGFHLHAMIDLSDGLASDLRHILIESNVGALIYAQEIPISESARQAAGERSALEHALGDGEDFELLFTLPQADGEKLLRDSPFELPITKIGEITDSGEAEWIDESGNRSSLPQCGWAHPFE